MNKTILARRRSDAQNRIAAAVANAGVTADPSNLQLRRNVRPEVAALLQLEAAAEMIDGVIARVNELEAEKQQAESDLADSRAALAQCEEDQLAAPPSTTTELPSDFPALSELTAAGYEFVEQVAFVSDAILLAISGIGAAKLVLIRAALA